MTNHPRPRIPPGRTCVEQNWTPRRKTMPRVPVNRPTRRSETGLTRSTEKQSEASSRNAAVASPA